MSDWKHLARRFVGAWRRAGPSAADVAWVEAVLATPELALWRALNGPDRRHSVRVARAVERALHGVATPPVLAAALLHDVGKIDARLDAIGRVLATLTIELGGRERVAGWRGSRGPRGRFALYALHPQLGCERLRLAGSDPLTVAWTREHHEPRESWTVPAAIGEVLSACDND